MTDPARAEATLDAPEPDRPDALGRRLRHRLLVAGQPQAAPGRRDQDRQVVRDRDGRRRLRRRDRALHDRARAQPRPEGRRRGRRVRGRLAPPRGARLRLRPGLLPLAARCPAEAATRLIRERGTGRDIDAAGAARRAGPRALALAPLVGVAAAISCNDLQRLSERRHWGCAPPAAPPRRCSLPPPTPPGAAAPSPVRRPDRSPPRPRSSPPARRSRSPSAPRPARVCGSTCSLPGQPAVRALARPRRRAADRVRAHLDRRAPGRQVHRAARVSGAGTTRYLRVAAERRRAHSAAAARAGLALDRDLEPLPRPGPVQPRRRGLPLRRRPHRPHAPGPGHRRRRGHAGRHPARRHRALGRLPGRRAPATTS